MTARLTPHDVPKAQAIIRRLCELQRDVIKIIDPRHERRSDCFCGESGFWPYQHPNDFRSDQHGIDFIEHAVHEALASYIVRRAIHGQRGARHR